MLCAAATAATAPLQHRPPYAVAQHYRLVQRTHARQQQLHRCQALPTAAAATAAGLTLAFLPWSGCSQGGFYATGVEGAHGKDCQAMYQPAAAAEARFATRLQQQPAATQQTPVTAAAETTQQTPEPAGGGSSSSSSRPVSSSSSSGDSRQQSEQQGTQQQQQQLTAAEQLAQVPAAAKDLVRDIMQQENRQRTKQLVDDAWQTLE